MAELFKEMCSLAGKMSDFVDGIKNDEDRKNLLALHLKVTELCETISTQKFDENDDFYRDTIEKIMDTGLMIKLIKENQIELTDLFDHLNTIIDNVINIREIENE